MNSESTSFDELFAKYFKDVPPPEIHPAKIYADAQLLSTGELILSEKDRSGLFRPHDSYNQDTDPTAQYTVQTSCIESGAMTSIQNFRKCHGGPSLHYHFDIVS